MKLILGILFVLVLWQILHFLFPSSLLLPSPVETLRVFLEIMNERTLMALLSTVWKGIVSTGLVVLIGLPIGFLMGINDRVYEILRPLVTVVQAVPVVSWLAIVVFLWGIGWQGPVVISFLSLLPVAVFTTVSGVRSVDKKLIEVMRVYKVSRLVVLKEVYLGSLWPFILSILEVSSGNIWKAVIMAEYLCGDRGIGVLISWARQYVDVPRVYALTILAVVLGITSERIVKIFTGKVWRKWRVS
ncbi:ABC transporter permease [Thermotoga sp. KOL6]|uniref:ABC transporter permease n=1 Tax=Thermotoga sp. KOL6 TaxID=126741 RepID=UPI000C78626E|nr:ABC transporter permease [Thermotoga sp. KOL6]PLV58959.1 ABC transporter permease [Thermotoga sp. KOL6]